MCTHSFAVFSHNMLFTNQGATPLIASTFKQLGKLEEAIEHYDEVLRIEPAENEARQGREMAFRLMDQSGTTPVRDGGS